MSLSKSAVPDPGSGSGSSLPSALLYTSLACTLFATLFSTWSIYLHLKGYRRPALQRLVVRIMVMYVPPHRLVCPLCPTDRGRGHRRGRADLASVHDRVRSTRIPLYAISSLVSLHSLEAAFWIDAVRDLYEVSLIRHRTACRPVKRGGEHRRPGGQRPTSFCLPRGQAVRHEISRGWIELGTKAPPRTRRRLGDRRGGRSAQER